MKLNMKYLKEFIFEQKCIPWRVRTIFYGIVKKIKMSIGRYYNNDFFDSKHRAKLYQSSVIPIVSSLIKKYNPQSVVDIGCGDGIYLEEFMKKGIGVIGYDNSREGIKRCKKRGISIKKFNFIKDKLSLNKKYDLAICFEVAEHLPFNVSNKLVNILTQCSEIVIFTAAPPGQGGTNHTNEQPYSFWINKFRRLNYHLDPSDTEYIKHIWQTDNVVSYMGNNLMIFKKNGTHTKNG